MAIENWVQYKSWIEDVIGAKKDYYYRGQMIPVWKLKTSFHRDAKKVSLSLIDYLDIVIPEIEHYMCAQFNEIFKLDDPKEFGAFLAILQHHGFPTPLLDWTLSPYIAAFFAFREVNVDSPQTNNVKIFIFDFQKWSNIFEQPINLRDKEQYISVIRPYAKNNPRLVPQRGTYTFSNVEDMEDHINLNSKKKNEKFLYTVTLPVSERVKIMRDLNLMGINEMTLFPGIDGVCKTLKEQFFCPDIIGPSPSGKALLEKLAKLPIKL